MFLFICHILSCLLIVHLCFLDTDSNNLVGKSFSRNAKKRESSTVAAGTPIGATTTVVKNQKPVQPKQKGVDKRPKPRSGQDGVGIHRKNGYQVVYFYF